VLVIGVSGAVGRAATHFCDRLRKNSAPSFPKDLAQGLQGRHELPVSCRKQERINSSRLVSTALTLSSSSPSARPKERSGGIFSLHFRMHASNYLHD
jgi:hypothetical protein